MEFLHILLHSLKESANVLIIALVLYIIISFIEEHIAKGLAKKNKFSPIVASFLGLIPQCGFSVVASDLYLKRHITMGTLIALFIACSDEAIPILLANPNKDTLLSVGVILGIKFVVGFITGYIVDFFYTKSKHDVDDHLDHCHHHQEEENVGCCHHVIGGKKSDTPIYKHLIHPLIHSLKIFLYVLIITLVFNIIIHFIGEDTLASFLELNRYISPLIASLIGVIPNCAASVVITNVYLLGGMPLGACISGLCMNAGLGLVFLFKKKSNIKETCLILGIMLGVSLLVGYIVCLITGF